MEPALSANPSDDLDSPLTVIHSALLVVILLGSVAAVATGALAMWDWRYLARRFAFTAVATAACVTLAVLAADALLGGVRAAGWRAPLRLLADAMLPLSFVLLVRAYRSADRVRLKAQAAAPVNQKTGLPNRAALIDQAIPALALCQRTQVPASVITVAIDGTAQMARERGPRAVEDVLGGFAVVFRDATRAGDVPGHATPEILAALLPSATPEAARVMAERLGREAAARIPHPEMDGRRLSVSVGIAQVGNGPGRAVLDEALHAAETALGVAQAAGGDRVVDAPAPPPRSASLPA